ncbi:MAG: class I SAM-dependent DNA methyltransferase [Leptospiraceae bacterium]|nr:class I SAM-dependent DNA methyltransferase [Leptospiraceae bacterium]
MNIAQIETNLQKLVKSIKKTSFIYDLLIAYGQPKASIARLLKGGLNLSKVEGEILWKKKLFFKSAKTKDLHTLIDEIKKDAAVTRHDPRFIILTDFETLLAVDRKTTDTLDIPIEQIAKHFDFFLPWAGMEKAQHQNENPADVKAAEKMAKLYDELKKDNPVKTSEQVHNLNVFLSRLLFCFFAEDTGIFEASQFTNAISSHTQVDGSDLHTYLDKLFEVMNTESKKRKSISGAELPAYLNAFPYVNGGLFRDKHTAPKFTRRSRQAIIDSGELDWSAINPDIFGSMIQAVVTAEHRGTMGMHYTSVPNIMKVIEPLFLTELYEEFEAAKGNTKKLMSLLHRIWKIKIFDPACGSGNFLIIAYRELRRLEIQIFKELRTKSVDYFGFSQIQLSNFYGIELDDFAHEVAILSLWLAEHQMNQLFLNEFGNVKPALPLTSTGNIVQGNACRLDWEVVCPKEKGDEIYILGNPPYSGSKNQTEQQKEDMIFVFAGNESFKKLDYIACWYRLGADYVSEKSGGSFAFVSTNSICQGEQVGLLWPYIFSKKLEINFAYSSFHWVNNAKDNAGVTCVIVGVTSKKGINKKKIFTKSNIIAAKNISPYIFEGSNLCIIPRNTSISNLPIMVRGSQPTDDGNLILSKEEYEEILTKYPKVKKFIKSYMGADDFLNAKMRWCLWISDENKVEAESIPPIKSRIEKCKEFRLLSQKEATKKKANLSYKFDEIKHQNTDSIIFPVISSYRRQYIPAGFLNADTVISNKGQAVYNSSPFIFGILSSKMHMVWLSVTSSRMRNDYQYSITLSYNTFPFPNISDAQKKELEKHVYRILEEREKHSEKTLAQLYDPDKMPDGLREAHHQNDLAIERIYRSKPFSSDEERLEYLFKLYEGMVADEKKS